MIVQNIYLKQLVTDTVIVMYTSKEHKFVFLDVWKSKLWTKFKAVTVFDWNFAPNVEFDAIDPCITYNCGIIEFYAILHFGLRILSTQ